MNSESFPEDNHIKKEDLNPYKEVHLFYYTYINSELHILLHKSSKEQDNKFREIYEELLVQDNAPPFALARTLATKYRGLFRQSNINKMASGEAITEKDIFESSEYIWYDIWNNEAFIETLDVLAFNPIQYDNIRGKLIYFLELPAINLNLLNENLQKLNYEYTFMYHKYSYENSQLDKLKLLNCFDFNSHIQQTKKLASEDLMEYYVIVSCKPKGEQKDQAGFFHFPALFNGLYRKNGEKWLYVLPSIQELPDEIILSKCKAIIIPGSHLHVYDYHDFLRKTEDWIRGLIHNWPNIKFLGICFGLQLFCDALGGKTESMGNGVFISGGEELNLHEDLFKFNFIKSSGVSNINSLTIIQAHGDHVTNLPDYEKYRVKNYAFSKTCEREILVSENERILCIQGHPEYSPHFNRYRFAPILAKWRKMDLTPENYQKVLDESLNNSTHTNSLEFRKICHSFLKTK